MNGRDTSNPRAGYRSGMQPRRPTRGASPAPRLRALDHDGAPTDAPFPAESARTAPARKTAARRPARRWIEEDVEQFDDTEPLYDDVDPDRDHRWRSPADETADDPEELEEEEFPESELCESAEEFRAPAIRDAAALPPTVSIVEAGEWLGIGRTIAYELARDGAFPVRTIRVGNKRRVITAELLAMLGIPLAR
jgi:hypothetical protein